MVNRICLFAYHSPTLSLAPHTRHLLNQIQNCGFDLHIAISGLLPSEEHKFKILQDSFLSGSNPIKATLYPRPNQGLDFGAWQDLIKRGVTSNADEILFSNDSVFGPITPLQPIVTKMALTNSPVWGMVRSEAITQHLQSWFLCMKREAFLHPKIQYIFTQPFNQMTKEEIVLHGELGLGLAMQAANFNLTASWSSKRGLARLLAINPMHTNWRNVLRSKAAPFIKTELLRDNPNQITSIRYWKKEIPDPSFFNPEWIINYLKTNPPRHIKKRASFRSQCVQAIASENRISAILSLLIQR